MTQQWRIRISGRPKQKPDMTLLVKAVLALGEEMQRAREQEVVQTEPQPDSSPETTDDSA
jgi:hypothetical protein